MYVQHIYISNVPIWDSYLQWNSSVVQPLGLKWKDTFDHNHICGMISNGDCRYIKFFTNANRVKCKHTFQDVYTSSGIASVVQPLGLKWKGASMWVPTCSLIEMLYCFKFDYFLEKYQNG